MIELRTLGATDLREETGDGAVDAVLSQPRLLALLTYLVLARPRGYHHRNALLGLFWPERPEARGRQALRQALYRLRLALGDGVVLSRGDGEVGVDPERLWCDAAAFEDELARGAGVRALELYGGDLLAGFVVEDCPAFQDWLEQRRAELRRQAVDAALGMSGAPARRWLERAAAWAPHDEAVARALMGALAAEDQPAMALQVYEGFAERLSRDLGLEPSARSAGLAASIRSGRLSRGSATPAGAGRSPTDAPDHRPASAARRVGQWMVAVVLAGAVLGGAVLLVPGVPGPAPVADPAAAPSPTRVLVAQLEVPAGAGGEDEVLARMATDWIAHGLAATGMMDVVPGSMLLGDDLRAEDARLALAVAAGAGSVVSGVVHRQDGAVVFQVRITDATGAVLRVVEYRASPDEPAVQAVDRLRERVTGALATALDLRLAAWTDAASQPPSFEAYRRFTDGIELFMRRPVPDYRAAADRFIEAAALDEGFVAPLIWAVKAYTYAPDFPAADSLAATLVPLRGELPAWDRAMLDWQLAFLRQDITGAYHAMRRVVEIVPGSEWRYHLAVQAVSIGRPHEALGILLALDPDQGWLREFPLYWMTRAAARHMVGDFEGELDDVELIRRRPGPGSPSSVFLLGVELRALAGLGRLDELETVLAEHAALLDQLRRARLVHTLARELRAHSHTDAVPGMVSRAVAAYDSATPAVAGRPAFPRLDHAEALFAASRVEDARRVVEELREERPNIAAFLGLLGRIAAIEGDVAEAERLEAEIGRHGGRFYFGEDVLHQACIRANLGDRDGAVDLVREAFNRGLMFSLNLHVHECLHPLRGYAPYEALIRPWG